jgi:hypothetical protein
VTPVKIWDRVNTSMGSYESRSVERIHIKNREGLELVAEFGNGELHVRWASAMSLGYLLGKLTILWCSISRVQSEIYPIALRHQSIIPFSSIFAPKSFTLPTSSKSKLSPFDATRDLPGTTPGGETS